MKTNLCAKFKTDKTAEQGGNWFAVEPGVRFLIRRYRGSNASKIKASNAKYQQPLIRKVQSGTITEEEQAEIGLKTFVDACLVDWEGVVDDKGNEVEFSFESAMEVLTPVPDLADLLFKHSLNFENFTEDLGNS